MGDPNVLWRKLDRRGVEEAVADRKRHAAKVAARLNDQAAPFVLVSAEEVDAAIACDEVGVLVSD